MRESRTVAEPDLDHLTLIQHVIDRLASNSFLIKGWAVTLVSGLTAFATTEADRDIAWIACGAGVVFALLDAMYLANERAFRHLYADAADGKVAKFSLARPDISVGDFIGALVSWSVLPIYLVTAGGAAFVGGWL